MLTFGFRVSHADRIADTGQATADTGFGQDQFGAGGTVFDFLTQLPKMDP